ncbi:Gfo/Idh/MocA family protein [Arthrobacter sp. S2(2024)]|uniref:Gfo/Idh/MocA family protein n=1 Tax=Arthrobacter sp. S2(2024) TaxID=3111911 RepID=UPI002FC5E404
MEIPHVRPVIIGSGMIAASHAKALRDLGTAPAVVWSPNRANRERFASLWGATAANSLNEALDLPGVSHMHVCTTPMNHNDPIREAAERGLSIISEKPLAPTAELAAEALHHVTSNDVPNYLNFNRRQDEGIQMLRDLLAEGEIGSPVSVFGHYRQQWNASPSGLDWRYDPTQVGPARTVIEIGSHWLDLAHFVLGSEITAANALLGYMGERDYDTGSEKGRVTPPNDDLFAAMLTFENGVIGQVYGTELAHGAFDEIELRIDGTTGSAIWTSAHPNQLQIGNKVTGLRTIGFDSDTDSISRSIAAIYTNQAKERGVATFEEGLANARAMDAIRNSAESRTWKETR